MLPLHQPATINFRYVNFGYRFWEGQVSAKPVPGRTGTIYYLLIMELAALVAREDHEDHPDNMEEIVEKP